jgi:triacylglycerol lipase
MLARLQRSIALTLLLAVIGAFIAGSSHRLPSLGWIVGGALALGYLGVLGVEFTWLVRSYAPHDRMRPSCAQALRSWLGEALTGPRVFLWRQPFRSRRHPDHLPVDGDGRRGVLLVHGFFCNRGLWNPWLKRLRADGVPFIAVDLEPIFGSIDDYGPIVARAARQLQEATGLAPVIVAHSMGGLAARAWMAATPDASFLRLITIATPHAGTRLGANGRGANIRQMRCGSQWLADLAARESAAARARFICFWSHCDNIVIPPRSATLAGADNRHLVATAHVHMVYHAAVFEALQQALRIES